MISNLESAFPWLNSPGHVATGSTEATVESTAARILEERGHLPIAACFPMIRDDALLSSMRIGVRLHNALNREGKTRFSDIASTTLDELSGWRGIGAGAMRVFVEGLVEIGQDSGGEHASVVPGAPDRPAWVSDVIDDLTTIAKWHRILGAEDNPVLTSIDHHSEPAGVRAARARLLTLTPATLLPEDEPELAASTVVDLALATCSDRELSIAANWIFADVPAPLEVLGAEAGVTRERIRQQEVKIIERLRVEIRDGDLADLATAVRDQIGVLLPLRTLLQRFPTLGAEVALVGQPVWRVLDRLDEAYEIKDGWCASGTIQSRMEDTRAFLRSAANGADSVELESIEQPTIDLDAEWLEYSGVTTLRGYAFVVTPGIPARAEVVLIDAGEALGAETIHERLGTERSLSSLKNSLATDARFTRVGRDRWALVDWGMETYSTIRTLIARAVDSAGGEISLEQLTVDLNEKFDVAAASVVSYASMFPFVISHGSVRRRTRRELRLRRRKALAQTRNLFRIGDTLRLAVTINGEHLRGSGSVLPNALGEEIDLPLGGTRDFTTVDGGTILVSWRGPQITVGSVRAELARLGLSAGEAAFFTFSSDGVFEVVPMLAANTPLEAIAAHTGGPVSGNDLFAEIGDRVDASEPTREAVRTVLAARGDAHIAELIDQLPTSLGPGEFEH